MDLCVVSFTLQGYFRVEMETTVAEVKDMIMDRSMHSSSVVTNPTGAIPQALQVLLWHQKRLPDHQMLKDIPGLSESPCLRLLLCPDSSSPFELPEPLLPNPPTFKHRMKREVYCLEQSVGEIFQSILVSPSLLDFFVTIDGLVDSPYQGIYLTYPFVFLTFTLGGVFKIHLQIRPNYPFHAPRVQLITPVFGLWFDEEGRTTGRDHWAPNVSLEHVQPLIFEFFSLI